MVIETARERQALDDLGNDTARIGARVIVGHYNAPGAEALEVEGAAPTFSAQTVSLLEIGAEIGAVIDEIVTDYGARVGPFRITGSLAEDDGAFTILRLQSSA